MPDVRLDLIASIPGAQPQGGATSPTVKPDVNCYFSRDAGGTPESVFQAAAASLIIVANFQWTYEMNNTTVIDFTIGDISVVAEDDPLIVDKIALGHALPAEARLLSLCSGENGAYIARLQVPANSAGSIYLTVISEAAAYDPPGDDLALIYGPEEAKTFFFTYSTIAGITGEAATPEVDIITPPEIIHTDATANITLRWNSDIRQNLMRTIGSGADDDIRITGGTLVDGTFMHHTNIMTFSVTLSGMGTCTIRVKANSETSVAGYVGPAEDTSESFQFELTRSITQTDTGTNVEVIYDSGAQAFNSTSNPVLGSGAGGFAGVSDLRIIGSNIYCTVQMQKPVITGTNTINNRIDVTKEAKAAFLRFPNRVSSTPVILRRYNKITEAARSPILWNSRIYWAEGSYVASGLGNVRSVDHTGTTTQDHGVPWRSRLHNPNALSRSDIVTYGVHNRIPARLITVDDNLYGIAGYGMARGAKSTNWVSSENPEGRDEESTRWDNWSIFRFGSLFDFRVPQLLTNEAPAYDIIKNLASFTFCYIALKGDEFIFRSKSQIEGRLTSTINSGDTITAINYQKANRVFPTSGLAVIHGQNHHEIIRYTGRNDDNNQLTGVSRAQEGTTADDLCAETRMRYLDHIIDMNDARHTEKSITELSIRQDLDQLYNIIKINYGDPSLDRAAISRNATSIEANKPRELEITVPLSHHDTVWAQWLADEYLKFYGTPQTVIEIQLKPSFYLEIGQFIYLREPLNSLINGNIYQILSIRHQLTPTLTNLTLRTVA